MARVGMVPFMGEVPDPAFDGLAPAFIQQIEEAEKQCGPFDFNSVRFAFQHEDNPYFVYTKNEKVFGYGNGRVYGPYSHIGQFEVCHGGLLLCATDDDNRETDIIIYRGHQYGPDPGAMLLHKILEDGRCVVLCARENVDGEDVLFLDGVEVFRASLMKNVRFVEGDLRFTATKDGKPIDYANGETKPCTIVFHDDE